MKVWGHSFYHLHTDDSKAAVKRDFTQWPHPPRHFQIRDRSKRKALIDSQQPDLIRFDSRNPIPHQWDGERLGAQSPGASIDHLSSPAARGSSSPFVL